MKLGELRAVKVETINPNPWRDGEGHATWKTMAAHYPILPAKVERLKESMLSPRESGKPLGVWEGIIARPGAAGTEALRRQLRVSQFEALRKRIMPFAEAWGYLTDEDVFREVS